MYRAFCCSVLFAMTLPAAACTSAQLETAPIPDQSATSATTAVPATTPTTDRPTADTGSSDSATGDSVGSSDDARGGTPGRSEQEPSDDATADGGVDEPTSLTRAAEDSANEVDAPDDEQAAPNASDDEQALAPVDDGRLVAVGPGDDGNDVLILQERLAELGFAPGTADGDYGDGTERSVRAFQTLTGLNQSGEADEETIVELASFEYDGLSLSAGDDNAGVETLQKRLASGPFDPGTTDGGYGTKTVEAVWALEKLAGVPVDGNWGPLDEYAWQQLSDGKIGTPERDHDQRWVEVDLSEQLVKIYDPGAKTPTLVSHVSTGSGIAWENEEYSGSSITPLGDFHVERRINGWRESSLDIGRLYNPLYFNGGIAFHGSESVPLGPASHGCVRVPMHIAEYLPAEIPDGTPVHVLP